MSVDASRDDEEGDVTTGEEGVELRSTGVSNEADVGEQSSRLNAGEHSTQLSRTSYLSGLPSRPERNHVPLHLSPLPS